MSFASLLTFDTHSFSVTDLRGGREGRVPPLAQNFFIFMQFSGKIGQIIGWCPPFGVSAPSSGKSWIRHCFCFTLLILMRLTWIWINGKNVKNAKC